MRRQADGTAGSDPVYSAFQSFTFRKFRRIARNPIVGARLAIARVRNLRERMDAENISGAPNPKNPSRDTQQ